MLDHMNSYDDWLNTIQSNADPERVNPNWGLTDRIQDPRREKDIFLLQQKL